MEGPNTQEDLMVQEAGGVPAGAEPFRRGDGSKGRGGGRRFTRDAPNSVKPVAPAAGGCGAGEA